MPKLSDLSPMVRLAGMVAIAVLLAVGAWFLVFSSMTEENRVAREQLEKKEAEVRTLEQYAPQLAELEQQIGRLKQQIEIQKKIVPDKKEADKFIQIVQETANSAGVEVRRFTAKPIQTREFYTEVPFEMDIDGPYYGVLNFFERLSKLERIINVEGLQMATSAKPSGTVKKTYQYAPSQTVVASYTAKTFFSDEAAQAAVVAAAEAAAAAKAAKAKPARRKR